MCDTFAALGNATADGSVILSKNSDREPNEAHELVFIPRASHPEGSTVKCTYMEIPQVSETYAVLLARPFWIWGAEMGANEHGVAIGNEAVFTRVPYEKESGLIGMDFLRLALERSDSARSALDTIIDLLETYGQGGNCGFQHKLYYHNSFLIADHKSAWVLETAGRNWAAMQVRDVCSISNVISTGSEWDLASDNLVDYAVERGWCKGSDDFDFSRCYSDLLYTRFCQARARQKRTQELLEAMRGQITVREMMSILRDHGHDVGTDWTPAKGILGSNICMHAGFGPVRVSQSVGSLVSHLSEEANTHWVTGTSAPCTGIFKPVWIDAGLPEIGPSPLGTYDENSIWWQHESLHRAVLRDYSTFLPLYREERDSLEDDFIRVATDAQKNSAEERADISSRCFAQAREATTRWTGKIQSSEKKHRPPFYYTYAWRGFNKHASMPDLCQ